MRRAAACALGCVAVLAAPSAASAAPPPVRIVSPAADSIATGSTVRLAVRVRPGVRVLDATVGGRRVQLRKRRGGLRVRRIRRSALTPGREGFGVRVRTRRGRAVAHSVHFVVAGRQRRSLLRVRFERPQRGEPLGVVVRLGDREAELRARLNGRRVHHLLARHGGARRRTTLSASDGLRFGLNRLRVVAFLPDGTYAVVERRHRRRRTAPLAGAGRDRLALVRHRVRLDGRASLHHRRGGRLAYRWRIVRRPRGSKARLRAPHSARPRLRPDRRGLYRIRLTVTDRRHRGRAQAAAAGSAADVAEVSAQPDVPPIGATIDTWDTSQPGEPAITVAGQRNTTWPAGGGYQVLVFNRAGAQGGTLEVEDRAALPFGVESDLAGFIEGDNTQLVVITATPGGQGIDYASLNSALAEIGGASVSDISGGFSIVGIPGQAPGNAYQYVQPPAALNPSPFTGITGYLAKDTSTTAALVGAYVMTPSDYVPFTVEPGAGRVTVGDQALDIPDPPAGFVGFALVTLDARSLKPGFAVTFPNDQTGIQELIQDLQLIAANPGTLAVLKTIGQPSPNTSNWFDLSRSVYALGGNPQVFNTLNAYNQPRGTADYVLVGGAGIAAREAYGSSGGSPLTMSGVLQRDTTFRFAPMLSDQSAAGYDYSLAEIAYQPGRTPTAFPFEGGPYAAAEADIAEQVWCPASTQQQGGHCTPPPDVRSQYWQKPSTQDWSGLKDNLTAARPKSGAYKPTQFDQLRDQLQNEFTIVDDVNSLTDQIKATIDTSSGSYVDVQTVADAVKTAINPPPSRDVFAQVFEVLADVAAATSAALAPEFAAPTAAAMIGTASGGLALASVFTTDDSGNQVLTQRVQLTADELSGKLEDQMNSATIGVERLREVLLSDLGKMVAAQEYYNSSKDVLTSTDGQQAAVRLTTLTAVRQAWHALMRVAYEPAAQSGSARMPIDCVVGISGSPGSVSPRIQRSWVFPDPSAQIAKAIPHAPFQPDVANDPDLPLYAGEVLSEFYIDVWPTLASGPCHGR